MSQTILDIDSILDNTLDATPDVPDFATPPTGDYIISVTDAKIEKYKSKDESKGEGLRIKLTYSVDQTLQLVDDKELPVADGTLFTETYQATEDGLAFFKKSAKKLLNVTDVNGISIRDILASLVDVKGIKARIKLRKTTSNGRDYENVQITPIYEQAA